MKATITIACLVVTLSCGLLLAQAPPTPKPTAEHQRLHYFVGEWKTDGSMKPGPWGPGGKFTSTDHNVMLGEFFVVFHSEGTGPMGAFKEVAVMGYDPKETVYTYDGYNSMGEHDLSTGTISGSTWTWVSAEQDMGGKKVRGRFILKEISPTSYTYAYDMSVDAGAWTNIMEGKATKVK
jgi:hypothetical protein